MLRSGRPIGFAGLPDRLGRMLHQRSEKEAAIKAAMANLTKIIKDSEVFLPTKILIVRAMVFPVATYGCESMKEGGLKRLNSKRSEEFLEFP